MSTTLVLRLEESKMSRLRDIVSDKADDLFSKLSRAEAENNTGRAEGLRTSLAFWNSIDTALRDAQPEPVAVAPSPLCNAANELLSALEELVEIVEDAKNSNDGKERLDSFTCQPARAAIAKARGEKPRAKAMNASPEPYKLGGVPLFEIAADIARTHQRMITQEDRADGRVISPHPVRPNIHE